MSVNNKCKIKGSVLIGPVTKESADLWPRNVFSARSITFLQSICNLYLLKVIVQKCIKSKYIFLPFFGGV